MQIYTRLIKAGLFLFIISFIMSCQNNPLTSESFETLSCDVGELCTVKGKLEIYRGVPASVGVLTQGGQCLTLALPKRIIEDYLTWNEKNVVVKGRSYAQKISGWIVSYSLFDRVVAVGMCDSPTVLYVDEIVKQP